MEATGLTTEVYALDAKLSRFTVRAFAGGMFAALAHNPAIAIRDFAGKARLTTGTMEPAAFELRIRADSLELLDNVSDKDRREIERAMREDVLETQKYPEIVFESSSVSATSVGEGQYGVIVNGNLSLHGVTRSQTVPARTALTGETLRAFGEFSLRQTEYNIKLVSVAGGVVRVQDELKFSFDIVARRQE